MTSREKGLAAFSPEGTAAFPVMVCYDNILVRDHWSALTHAPWWCRGSGIVEKELEWMRDYAGKTGLDFLMQSQSPSREERSRLVYQERDGEMWRMDSKTGQTRRLLPPGDAGNCVRDTPFDLDKLPTSCEEIDQLISSNPPVDMERLRKDGSGDVAATVRSSLNLFTYSQLSAPLCQLAGYLGFEGMMMLIGTREDLVKHAVKRLLEKSMNRLRAAAAIGVDAVWVEELYMDQVSLDVYRRLNLPYLRELLSAARQWGLKSIYYFCGDCRGRLDMILEARPDAVAFEESKKGWTVDIEEVVKFVKARCTVLGNLDAMRLLEKGSEAELRAEIKRQIGAGRRNGNRFIMSTGSPVTPGTTVERVRLYADHVREIGGT